MLRVLFAGLGSVGQRHLRNLVALLGNDVEVLAYRVRRSDFVLSDRLTVESDRGLEERYGIRVFSSLEDALAERPCAVFVTNPSSLHLPVALAAARVGCHLFVEKPLSHNMEGIQELVDLAERGGLVGMVGYQLRFHPALRTMQAWLRDGAVGRVVGARAEVAEFLPGFHSYEDYRNSYPARRDLGGGVVLSQIHELDYLYALFGMPRRVFSLGGHLSSLEVDVEDVASTLLEFRGGEGNVLPVHLHQDFLQRPASRSCLVVGDRGKILWDYHADALTLFDAEGKPKVAHDFAGFQRNQMFLDELKGFLACMEGKGTPSVTLRDAANSLRIALAIRRSLETGAPVEVD